MKRYEEEIICKLEEWEHTLLQGPGEVERISRRLSQKLNRYVPQKAHNIITAAVRGMIESIRTGISYTPDGDLRRGEHLQAMDEWANERVVKWTRWASAEGAGTGLGGFKLSLVDLPALLSIKMKLLRDLCYIYGYDPDMPEEKRFMLHIFQLTYANEQRIPQVLTTIKHWPVTGNTQTLQLGEEQFDWQAFQQDYRDSLDFKKLLQMVPGLGALIGAWANHGFVHELGKTAMQCYRMRYLHDQAPDAILPDRPTFPPARLDADAVLRKDDPREATTDY